MEVYLKQLLGDFSKSDSARIHIVDDNVISSKPRSPTLGKNRNSMKRALRRYKSVESFLVVDSNKNWCPKQTHTHCPHTHHSQNIRQQQLLVPKRKLTARMEKHRQSRWETSYSPSSAAPVPPPTPEITATAATAHNNFGRRTTSVPNMLMMKKPQRQSRWESSSSRSSAAHVPPPIPEITATVATSHNNFGRRTISVPNMLMMKKPQRTLSKPIMVVSDDGYDDDLSPHLTKSKATTTRTTTTTHNIDRMRTSSSSLSSRVVTNSALTLSQQLTTLTEVLAISTAATETTRTTKSAKNTKTVSNTTTNNNNYNKSRRQKGHSNSFPPSPPPVPIRKLSPLVPIRKYSPSSSERMGAVLHY